MCSELQKILKIKEEVLVDHCFHWIRYKKTNCLLKEVNQFQLELTIKEKEREIKVDKDPLIVERK